MTARGRDNDPAADIVPSMPSAAIKEAYEVLARAPNDAPVSPDLSAGFRAYLEKRGAAFEQEAMRWRFDLARVRSGLSKSVTELKAAGGDVTAMLKDLEGLRDETDAGIAARHAVLARASAQLEEAASEIATKSQTDARAFRKHIRRYQDLVERDIEFREDFRLFVVTLLADIDPDAHGGPSFASSGDLIAFLRGQNV